MSRRGIAVALVGLDGAGKTTVARRLADRLPVPAEYLYMGVNPASSNRLLPTTRLVQAIRARRAGRPNRRTPVAGTPATVPEAPTRRRKRSPIGKVLAPLRLANRIAEEVDRQALVARLRRRVDVVLLDRDFLFDYYASDVSRGAGRPLARRIHGYFLRTFYRRPDLVIFLDAPAEVLFARKGEGTLESLARRRHDYHAALGLVRHNAVVDATQSLDDVTAQVEALILEAVARANQAGLDGSGGEPAGPRPGSPEASGSSSRSADG